MSEFIAAKDLPVTEAEEVSVLCVEGEELKLKPAANLGGSGGAGGLVYKCKVEEYSESDGGVAFNTADSWDEYAQCLSNGGVVWIDLSALGMVGAYLVNAWMFDNGDVNVFVMMAVLNMNGTNTQISVVFSNGTWTPPTA